MAADHAWSVRARGIGPGEVRVYARNQVLRVGKQASLRDADAHPSAIEHLLGALAADLVEGFVAEAARRQLTVDATELRLTGSLDNVLVHLGVVGETGHAGLAHVTGTLYVTVDADERVLDALWAATLARSPLYQTLSRAAEVDVRLKVTH